MEVCKNPLATEPVEKLIAKFAIPAVISMLVGALYNIVDQIFIGQGVGMLGNAATNIAFPITNIATAMALLIGIGSASNYNLETGAGREERARKIAGNGLLSLVVCGIAIGVIVLLFLKPLLRSFGSTEEIFPYALDYTGITAIGLPFYILSTGGSHIIRADRSPTFSMLCMLTGAVLNTILDPLFIFVFRWGIKGAAVATVIGQTVSGCLVILYFLKHRKMELRRDCFRPRISCLKSIALLGMSSWVNQIAMAIVQVAMNNTLRHYGGNSIYGSDIPLACAGVVSKVNSVFLAISIGISQGCQPIWGFNFGAENYERVKKTYKYAVVMCTSVATIFFLCFQIFPREIVSIFGSGSEAYFQFAERYLKIFMFMTFLNGLQPMSASFFTAIGKAKLGIVMSTTRQLLFLLPMILIFPFVWGIDGIMYAGPIADGAAAVFAIFFAMRELRKMR